MLVVCTRCSKEFDRVPSAVKSKNYYSMACRKEPLDRTCEGCGKGYMASISHRKTSCFCSKSCAKSGEKHHFEEALECSELCKQPRTKAVST